MFTIAALAHATTHLLRVPLTPAHIAEQLDLPQDLPDDTVVPDDLVAVFFAALRHAVRMGA